jgi:AraC-like DNA-binding protein
VGRQITLGMLGMLGFAMISSRTGRDAILVSDRLGYGQLSPLFLRPWVDQQPDAVHVVYEAGEVPADVRSFLTERDLACCVAMLPTMFGRPVPVHVTTALTGAEGAAFAHDLTGAKVQLGHARNSIVLANADVDRPLPNADEHTIRACEQYIRDLVARRARRTGIGARVRAAMLRHRPVVPTLEDIAAERHVSPRTLRRQLSAEGTSYRALADEVRLTFAEELLTSAHLSVTQVADRLGYADAASFSRAFKRWTGRAPGEFARSQTNAGAPSAVGRRAQVA